VTDMDNKKELRKLFTDIRASVSNKQAKDKLITDRLLADERIASADVILLYASFRSEIDTWAAARMLSEAGRTIAFPLCLKDHGMSFHVVSSPEQLDTGSYGIREPSPELPQPELSGQTVCLVPGLAFTPQGGRLGYGGGFYDRFIASHPYVHTIALAYEELITPDLPMQQHDIRVDSIITEERTVFCNAEK